MSIRDERTSTEELLRDTRYHIAAVTADPRAQHLADPAKKAYEALKKAKATADEKEEARVEKLALFERSDYVLDGFVREVEALALAEVKKNRADIRYSTPFPKGLAGVVALRGTEEAAAIKELVPGLEKHHPELAKKYKDDLLKAAESTTAAERTWKDAEAAQAQSFAGEILARRELAMQLRKNEAALGGVFPGQRGLVRSFFRAGKRPDRDEDPADPT